MRKRASGMALASTMLATPAVARDGSLDAGSIVDEGYGHYRVSTWHPGQPVKSIWTGSSGRRPTS